MQYVSAHFLMSVLQQLGIYLTLFILMITVFPQCFPFLIEISCLNLHFLILLWTISGSFINFLSIVLVFIVLATRHRSPWAITELFFSMLLFYPFTLFSESFLVSEIIHWCEYLLTKMRNGITWIIKNDSSKKCLREQRPEGRPWQECGCKNTISKRIACLRRR